MNRRPGEWITHSTLREVYSSFWVTMRIDDVERPDGSHTDHEVIRGPDGAGVVVVRPDRGLLMIWRHRFMPDTWGWEIPGGGIERGETPENAARRECLEETGWSVTGPVSHLSSHHPAVGVLKQTLHVFLADDADYLGGPADVNEAARVEWRPIDQVVADLRDGVISDGFSQLGTVLAIGSIGYGHLLAS